MLRATVPPRGYAHPWYAASLAEFGTPRLLPRSGGWLLTRGIPGTDERDAVGCYPLFACQDWGGLEGDLAEIDDLVSVVLVSDPFGEYDPEDLRRVFQSVNRPFKEHFVVDLTLESQAFVSKHHRYHARRALEDISVERFDEPSSFAAEWTALYADLVARRQVTGIRAFSRSAFERQLRVPGMVLLRATHEGKVVAAHLWAKGTNVVYSHLAAASAMGYRLMASYALHQFALETFRDEARWLDLGAGVGLDDTGADGLSRYKRGWASGTRTAWLRGRILDERSYRRLVTERAESPSEYFPLYRAGEFS